MSAFSPYLKPGSLDWLKPDITLDIKPIVCRKFEPHFYRQNFPQPVHPPTRHRLTFFDNIAPIKYRINNKNKLIREN